MSNNTQQQQASLQGIYPQVVIPVDQQNEEYLALKRMETGKTTAVLEYEEQARALNAKYNTLKPKRTVEQYSPNQEDLFVLLKHEIAQLESKKEENTFVYTSSLERISKLSLAIIGQIQINTGITPKE